MPPNGAAISHGTLAGLGNDDHSQYPLLIGRSGGQNLIGGIDAFDDLILESTSNVLKGAVNIASGSPLYLLDSGNPTSRIYSDTGGDTGALRIDNDASGIDSLLALTSFDSLGLTSVFIDIYGLLSPGAANFEAMTIGYDAGAGCNAIYSSAAGSGILRDIQIKTDADSSLLVRADGGIDMLVSGADARVTINPDGDIDIHARNVATGIGEDTVIRGGSSPDDAGGDVLIFGGASSIDNGGSVRLAGGTGGANEGSVFFDSLAVFNEGLDINSSSLDVSTSNSGATNTISVENSSNTASSNASVFIQTLGASSGNPFLRFSATGATPASWVMGIERGSSRFRMGAALALTGGSYALEFDDSNNTTINGAIDHNGTTIGFFGTAPAAQPAAIADASGGAIIDAEARTAINALLAAVRTLGVIDT